MLIHISKRDSSISNVSIAFFQQWGVADEWQNRRFRRACLDAVVVSFILLGAGIPGAY